MPSATEVDVRLIGAPERTPNILRKHTSWINIDTTSRNEIVFLDPVYNRLSLSSDGPLYSDAARQTTFCGFQLNNVNAVTAAFSVGLTTSLSTAGQMSYDLVILDTDSRWNSNRYLVPYTGTWVITFTMGAPTSGDSRVDLYAPSLVTSLYFFSTNNAGPDTLSKTFIITMLEGNAIYTSLTDTPVYSDIRYQTSLMGFFYNPNFPPITWCVASESQFVVATDPVPFDVVFINEGNGWNTATSQYTVPLAGVYCIQLTAGIVATDATKMELLINGDLAVDVYRSSTSHNGIDTRSRSFILPLQTNDVLRIRLPSGYSLYSNANRITMFSGFRIYSLVG